MKRFEKVSKVFRIFGNQICEVRTEGEMLTDVKLQAITPILKMKRLINVHPNKIIGFSFLLPNGNLGHIALATYPDVVRSFDGMFIEVPCRGKALWHGSISTFKKDRSEEHSDDCVQSHKLTCEILDCAEKMRILTEIHDSTGYWDNRNVYQLQQTCEEIGHRRSDQNP